MFRIDNDTASTVLPTPKPVGQPGYFTAGTIGGEAATIVEADWLNLVQEELLNVLSAAGIAPSKLTNSQVIQAILYLIATNTRQRLTGPLSLYVAPGGSDTNNGLTPATAFATPQAAWDYIMARLDVGYQTVTVNLAPGTYPAFSCDGVPVGAESQNVIFQGVVSDPAQVTISQPAAGNCITASGGARLFLQGMTLQSNGNGIYSWLNACVYFTDLQFNACGGSHVLCDQHGLIEIMGAYTIAGGAQNHLWCVKGGHMGSGIPGVPFTVTLLGTPTFSNAYCLTDGTATSDHAYGMTFNGGAHGKRYQVDSGGQIIVPGANVNYFPGDVAGVCDSSSFGLYV